MARIRLSLSSLSRSISRIDKEGCMSLEDWWERTSLGGDSLIGTLSTFEEKRGGKKGSSKSKKLK